MALTLGRDCSLDELRYGQCFVNIGSYPTALVDRIPCDLHLALVFPLEVRLFWSDFRHPHNPLRQWFDQCDNR